MTRRLADDSLFATTMERFASLFTQNDRGKLRTLLKRAYRDFCDLCPDGVSEVEILAAERVAIARMKVYVFDLLSLTPAAWRDPNEFMERKQRQAANELERAMKTYMTLRKVAESQPGFRMTVAQSESISPAGTTTRNRSVSVESVPHDLPAG